MEFMVRIKKKLYSCLPAGRVDFIALPCTEFGSGPTLFNGVKS
jgi:hypothetical protein